MPVISPSPIIIFITLTSSTWFISVEIAPIQVRHATTSLVVILMTITSIPTITTFTFIGIPTWSAEWGWGRVSTAKVDGWGTESRWAPTMASGPLSLSLPI